MEIIVGKTAGFCGGVYNAVKKATEYKANKGNVYCLGELVHNKQVVDKLKDKGIKFIEDLNEVSGGSTVIIRAHGIAKEIYEEAKKKNIELYDLTCPKVLQIHEQVKKYLEEDYFIVLIAHKTHPEVIGTSSFCGDDYFILETTDDIEECVSRIEKSNKKKVVVLAQTTYSIELFELITKLLGDRLKDKYEYLINNTICTATELRQKETSELAKQVDAMIIVGGKHSSNTKKLFDISSEICAKTILIEEASELQGEDFTKYNKVGVMAGASTPQESIEEVVQYLNKS